MDETGKLLGLIESDGRFFIHAYLYEPKKIQHYLDILEALEESLRMRGFETYYTLADSPQTFRYNQLMGFESNFEVWDNLFEVMKKDLY